MVFLLIHLLTAVTVLGNSYRDILYCNKKPFYLKGQEEDSCIMDAYIMHTVCGPLPLLLKCFISFATLVYFASHFLTMINKNMFCSLITYSEQEIL